MKDLLEEPDKLPVEVNNLIIQFEKNVDAGADRYAECEKLTANMKLLGYTFDYGLDGEPYNLQEI